MARSGAVHFKLSLIIKYKYQRQSWTPFFRLLTYYSLDRLFHHPTASLASSLLSSSILHTTFIIVIVWQQNILSSPGYNRSNNWRTSSSNRISFLSSLSGHHSRWIIHPNTSSFPSISELCFSFSLFQYYRVLMFNQILSQFPDIRYPNMCTKFTPSELHCSCLWPIIADSTYWGLQAADYILYQVAQQGELLTYEVVYSSTVSNTTWIRRFLFRAG